MWIFFRKGGRSMKKKVLASLLIGMSIITAGTSTYASNFNSLEASNLVKEQSSPRILEDGTLIVYKKSNRTLKTNVEGYEVINPDKESFSTKDRVALINGKAPRNTPINIKLYGTTDLNKKNFNLNKLPGKDDYVEVSSETIYAGNLGFFQKQQDLVMGMNKVQINFGANGVKPIEILIYVYEKTPTVTEIISVSN